MAPYAVQLNNYFQKRHEPHLLAMQENFADGKWKIVYKVNGVEKGSGEAPRKEAAREAAALEALNNLRVPVV